MSGNPFDHEPAAGGVPVKPLPDLPLYADRWVQAAVIVALVLAFAALVVAVAGL